ncbi:MAG: phage tail protein [Betaproteobacteria bacterium]|nr:MAG: phage tail protein [Betaproteobacteria bacterium]
MPRHDPLRNFRFRVEIGGLPDAAFSEVTIGAISVDVIEYRNGNEPTQVRKLPGLARFGDVILKRGIICSDGGALDLYAWLSSVIAGDMTSARRVVQITVLDETGRDCARFKVLSAWPVKYVPSDLEGRGNEVLVELLELANEGIERVQ